MTATSTAGEETYWNLGDSDREALDDLIDFVRALIVRCSDSGTTIGLAEVWHTFECLLDDGDHEIEISVSVSISRSSEWEDGRDRRSYDLRVGYDGIVVESGLLNYDRDWGSDSSTTDFTALRPGSSFDGVELSRWMCQASELLNDKETDVSAYRDHA